MSRFTTIVVLALAVLASQAFADSEAPSLMPSASPAPSFDIDVPQFSWFIDRVGNATFSLDESSPASSEIQLHYNISIRDTQIQAFEGDDCSTPLPSYIATLDSVTTITSPSFANFTLILDLHANVTNYPAVWTDDGLIFICLRVDLLLPSSTTSVTFHEQKLFLSVGLLQGFSITGVDLDRLNATEETGSVDVDFNVTGFQCDQDGNPSDAVLTQGSDVFLCVETTSDNVEIADVRELQMTQGGFSTTPIISGVEDPLTAVTVNGKNATIRYQIISEFFSEPNPEDIVATGSVLLAFTDNDGRRVLCTVEFGDATQAYARELDEEKTETGFNVRMQVESAFTLESSSAGTLSAFSFLLALGMIARGVVAVA